MAKTKLVRLLQTARIFNKDKVATIVKENQVVDLPEEYIEELRKMINLEVLEEIVVIDNDSDGDQQKAKKESVKKGRKAEKSTEQPIVSEEKDSEDDHSKEEITVEENISEE